MLFRGGGSPTLSQDLCSKGKKTYFNQHFECNTPKCWSKYTTNIVENYARFSHSFHYCSSFTRQTSKQVLRLALVKVVILVQCKMNPHTSLRKQHYPDMSEFTMKKFYLAFWLTSNNIEIARWETWCRFNKKCLFVIYCFPLSLSCL